GAARKRLAASASGAHASRQTPRHGSGGGRHLVLHLRSSSTLLIGSGIPPEAAPLVTSAGVLQAARRAATPRSRRHFLLHSGKRRVNAGRSGGSPSRGALAGVVVRRSSMPQ